MSARPPAIQKRTFSDFLDVIRADAPFFTPEWDSENDRGVGYALLQGAAQFLDEVGSRLAKTPEKNQITYLNMLGVSPRTAQSARVPLSFSLSAGTVSPVEIPKGTKILGQGTETVTFETEETFSLLPAHLKAVFITQPSQNSVLDYTPLIADRIMQDDEEPSDLIGKAMTLYLRHDQLFDPPPDAVVEVTFTGKNLDILQPDKDFMEWRFGEGDLRGDTKNITDIPPQSAGMTGNTLSLTKPPSQKAAPESSSKWLFCRFRGESRALQKLTELELADISIRLVFQDREPTPPAVMNDIQTGLEQKVPFYPFGQQPGLFSGTYMSDHLFGLAGMELTLNITLAEDIEPREPITLAWEYWNGFDWTPLDVNEDKTANLTTSGTINITVPHNSQTTTVSGIIGYWFRVRLVQGSFGQTHWRLEDNQLTATDQYQAPEITVFDVKPAPTPTPPQITIRGQRMTWDNITDQLEPGYKPFSKISPNQPVVYLGFDRKPNHVLMNLYFYFGPDATARAGSPGIWEVLDDQGNWNAIAIKDNTHQFQQNGVVQILPPQNMGQSTIYGMKAWWIRIRFPKKTNVPASGCLGILRNTGMASQIATISNEVLGPTTGKPGQSFQLKNKPVLEAGVWVDETDFLSMGQKAKYLENKPELVRRETDESGREIRFWVQYQRVENFAGSGPSRKVYMLDAIGGRIIFGNDKNGNIPPIGPDPIRVNYKAGGGSAGNLEPNAIKGLPTTLPYVDQVTNKVPASGGADPESEEQARERGPFRVVHRNRAVAARDYELLAIEAHTTVAAARCIPPQTPDSPNPDNLLVIIVTNNPSLRPEPSPEVREIVQTSLDQRASNVVAEPGRILVNGPRYYAVELDADLYVANANQIMEAEQQARDLLEKYLNPVRGNSRGQGWPFGRGPGYQSMTTVLDSLEIVKSMRLRSIKLTPVDPDPANPLPQLIINPRHPRLPRLAPDALISNGSHELRVTTE